MRRLEMREAVAGEGDELRIGGGGPWLQDDVGIRRLAPFFVRQADDRDLLHSRVAQQNPFHLEAGDVLAAADDHVLDAVADLDVAIRVETRRIAGMYPPVTDDSLRLLRIFVVPLHARIAARDHRTHRPVATG